MFPLKMVIFYSYVTNYQRVYRDEKIANENEDVDEFQHLQYWEHPLRSKKGTLLLMGKYHRRMVV